MPPESDGQWTLEKALQRALEANPDLLAAKLEYERQQGIRVQVRARLLPQLNVSASRDKRDVGLIDRTASELTLPANERSFVASSSYDARVELRQLVFDGFGAWNQARQHKALEDESRLAMETVAHRTVALVRQAFDAVLWRRDALAKEQLRVVALQQVVDWTVKKQEAGEVPEYEKFRAQAELKLAEADRTQTQTNVAKAEQYFRRLLMISDEVGPGKPLLFEGELRPRSLAWTLSEATSMAQVRRPDLAAAAARLKAAQYALRGARSDYLPRIEAYAAYGARSSYFDESHRLDGWSGGAAARWNIFDGLETRGRIRAQLAGQRIAEVRLEELGFQITGQLRELYAESEQWRSSMDAQRVAADLAGRALVQARRLQELGQVGLEPVLQAELTSRRAQMGLLEAIFNYNAVIAQIEFSVGGRIESSVGGRP
ncbi:MAG: TolC family protein [Verrucomicrobia bacterium]|nr:TolC family protein [Verrucomicrobiota bacterium]